MSLACIVEATNVMEFTPASFSAFVGYEIVPIHPDDVFTACTLSSPLPNGLSFDDTTCTISGIPTASLSETQYTMTSTKDGQTYEGSFHLTVVSCSGTVVKVIRTYKSGAKEEWFKIKD